MCGLTRVDICYMTRLSRNLLRLHEMAALVCLYGHNHGKRGYKTENLPPLSPEDFISADYRAIAERILASSPSEASAEGIWTRLINSSSLNLEHAKILVELSRHIRDGTIEVVD